VSLENLESLVMVICDKLVAGVPCGNPLLVLEGDGILTHCGHCGQKWQSGPQSGPPQAWHIGVSQGGIMAWYQPWKFEFAGSFFQLDLDGISDWQLGSSSTCEWKIDHAIEELCERTRFYREHMPWAKTAAMSAGDLEDEDRPSTRELRAAQAASRPEVVERDADKHIAWLREKVYPRALKIHKGTDYGLLGGVRGHHWTFLPGGVVVGKKTYFTSVEVLFAWLEAETGKPCVHLGEMVSYADFRFIQKQKGGTIHSVRSVGLVQHGEGGGQTKASTVARLDRTSRGWDADWFLRGHDCQLLAMKADQLSPKEQRADGPGGIKAKTKAFLNLGSATMGYEVGKGRSSYVEKGMMTPTTMGWGTLRFQIKLASAYEDPNKNLKCSMKIEI